jgi:hypothetical protein
MKGHIAPLREENVAAFSKVKKARVFFTNTKADGHQNQVGDIPVIACKAVGRISTSAH